MILGGVSIGLSLGCYISSTLMTTISNAVFLIYTGPLFCALLARIFRKEKISVLSGIFLSLVFIGMLLTIGIIDYKNGILTFGLDLSATTPEFPQKSLGDLWACYPASFTAWHCSSTDTARMLTRSSAACGTSSGPPVRRWSCPLSCVLGTVLPLSPPPTGCGQ